MHNPENGKITTYLYGCFKVVVFKPFNREYTAQICDGKRGLQVTPFATVKAAFPTLLWAKVDTALTNVMHGKIAQIYRDFCEINNNARQTK